MPTLRSELKVDSDIDLLVEFESDETPSLGGMVEVQDAFVSLFGGRRVDIVTPSILAYRWELSMQKRRK